MNDDKDVEELDHSHLLVGMSYGTGTLANRLVNS